MKDKTRDSKSHDGTVRYDLSISETELGTEDIHRYLLNGWGQGFGSRTDTFTNDEGVEQFFDPTEFGPYDCRDWLKNVLPVEVLDTLWFDCESSEFFCYSTDGKMLEIVVDVLTDTIDRMNRIWEKSTHRTMQLFNVKDTRLRGHDRMERHWAQMGLGV